MSKDHAIVKETVSKIAQSELVSRAAEVDKTHFFIWEGLKILKEADVLGLAIPSEYEGRGMDILSFIVGTEEIVKACISTALGVVSHSMCSYIILCSGDDKQKKKYLPSLARKRKRWD